jgi:hypothetical protein
MFAGILGSAGSEFQQYALGIAAILAALLSGGAYVRGRKNSTAIEKVRDEVKSTNDRPTGEHIVNASHKVDKLAKDFEALTKLLIEKDEKDLKRFRALAKEIRTHQHPEVRVRKGDEVIVVNGGN